MELTSILITNAPTKIIPIMAKNTMVATTRTGLNICGGDRVQRGWVEGVEVLSRTILSCVLKPMRKPVPAREMIVPTANKTTIAQKLHSVNDCGQMGGVRNH